MKNLKKKQFRIRLKSKHLLAIMTMFCLSAIVATFASGITTAPLADAAGMIIIPFEKSIRSIGDWITDIQTSFRDKQELIAENESLKAEIDNLSTQNNLLLQDQTELERLKQLYHLDEEY